MNIEAGRLEEEAQKRRDRLKNLKRHVSESSHSANHDAAELPLPKPVFRNYTPSDDELRLNQLPKAKPESIENEIQSPTEATKPEPLIEEVDLATLAPRKPDWDLKRDAAKKLDKLVRRTQKAIAELIRERLKSDEDVLADAVNSYSETVHEDNSDDD
ncbi:coiled-coil domain-containing protein 12-like [Uloborus diversus]|uniref:coiled-coil domain-containing protein 12-like n=1 Tax=Uloborus diversus TaxID=327109 RepID=UPI00240A0540|nr:coiled-coil domain-containing protein 12-like [Uloborus diversus]